MSETPLTFSIARPDDWHLHLRDDEMLAAVAPISARMFRYGIVMPNLVPPITSTKAAAAYRDRIVAAVNAAKPAGEGSSEAVWLDGFMPLMALYMHADLAVDDLMSGVDDGVVHAVKYYPAGATTNSEYGGSGLDHFAPVLDAMAGRGLPLLVHAEATDSNIDIFDRERAFLDQQLVPLVERYPTLPITVEHLSTAAGARFVAEHANVKGSITPHHLAYDRTDLLANGLRPDLYCKPIINSPQDRSALVAAATSGDASFFLGTDSAPHPLGAKYCEIAKPGIFNAPFAMEVVIDVFHQALAVDKSMDLSAWVGRLEAFTSINGARHYGFAPSTDTITVASTADQAENRSGQTSTDLITTSDGQQVKIFGMDEASHWTISPSP